MSLSLLPHLGVIPSPASDGRITHPGPRRMQLTMLGVLRVVDQKPPRSLGAAPAGQSFSKSSTIVAWIELSGQPGLGLAPGRAVRTGHGLLTQGRRGRGGRRGGGGVWGAAVAGGRYKRLNRGDRGVGDRGAQR